MAGQFRKTLGPLQSKCKGMRAWIVGSGPSLDSVNLEKLKKEFVFCLNSSICFFLDSVKYSNAWWVWRDIRCYKETWPRIQEDWKNVQAILTRQHMEMMRSYRGPGRWIDYGYSQEFKGARTILETAMLIVDFLEFDTCYLLGIDGFRPSDKGAPYCEEINRWKTCHFMKKGKIDTWKKSSEQFKEAIDNLLKKINGTKFYQLSERYPFDHFERKKFEEVINEKIPNPARQRL